MIAQSVTDLRDYALSHISDCSQGIIGLGESYIGALHIRLTRFGNLGGAIWIRRGGYQIVTIRWRQDGKIIRYEIANSDDERPEELIDSLLIGLGYSARPPITRGVARRFSK